MSTYQFHAIDYRDIKYDLVSDDPNILNLNH
jgi:hypothetical protein